MKAKIYLMVHLNIKTLCPEATKPRKAHQNQRLNMSGRPTYKVYTRFARTYLLLLKLLTLSPVMPVYWVASKNLLPRDCQTPSGNPNQCFSAADDFNYAALFIIYFVFSKPVA